MGSDSYFVWITQATTELLTAHSTVFAALGMNLFKGFSLILIAWTGCQIALGSVSGASLRFDRFASLLMSIAFVYAMLVYYDNPLPGIGFSFHNLITDQGASLAGQIEVQSTEMVGKKLAEVYDKLQQPSGPSILDVMQVVRYYGIVFVLSLAQAAVLAVISFGFVAVGVCALVGPIFIPFFIVPHMEWMFWGWFKTLVQYAFYPVIGNAFIYVYGKLFLNFFDLHPPPYNASVIAGLFLHLAFMCMAFVWGVLKVPTLVSSIFSGRSGDHSFPGIGWWR